LSNNAKTTSKKSITKVLLDDKSKEVKQSDPYEVFAQFLIQSSRKSGDFEDYSLDEVRRAVKKLAGGQEALKSMDGAAHKLRSTFYDSSASLNGRYEKFISSDKKKLKEAGKLYEYVTTVERSLQAAEILQAVSQENEMKRNKWMLEAGLKEIKRVNLSKNKVNCILSIMIPIDDDTLDSDKDVCVEETSTDKILSEKHNDDDDNSINVNTGDKKKGNKRKSKKSKNVINQSILDEKNILKKSKKVMNNIYGNKRMKSEEEKRFSAGDLIIGSVDVYLRIDIYEYIYVYIYIYICRCIYICIYIHIINIYIIYIYT
jgi:hypothetical protein